MRAEAAAGLANRSALLRRAMQAHQGGELDEAERLYQAILTAQPDHFDALHLLGVLRHQQQRNDEALVHIGAALALRPFNAAALNNIGLVHAMLGEPERALASYDRALAVKSDYAAAFGNRGGALLDLERFEEAAQSYDRALALAPHQPEALLNRGRALFSAGRPIEALASCEQALALSPGLAEAHNCRGLALHQLGRAGEAAEAIGRAIAIAPRRPRYYYNLGQVGRFAPDDPRIAAMEALARESDSFIEDERIDLCFALGKALADAGRPERAFPLLAEGNVLRRKRLVYDEAGTLAMLDGAPAAFSRELLSAGAGLGDPSPVPVFVVGMPRSGTSLVEQILASHSEVFGAGEIDAFDAALRMLGDNGAQALHSAEAAAALPAAQLRRLGGAYVEQIRKLAPAARRIVNKMPKNFRHAGLIHLALPNARIIHVRRDPVDTCLSCFSRQFADNLPYTYDLGELGRYYRAYETVMAHWRRTLPRQTMLEVRCEDIVADLEGQARRILAHCGLDWESRCLAFHETERPVLTASAAQVRQPIDGSSVGRWRGFEPFLAPLLAALA